MVNMTDQSQSDESSSNKDVMGFLEVIEKAKAQSRIKNKEREELRLKQKVELERIEASKPTPKEVRRLNQTVALDIKSGQIVFADKEMSLLSAGKPAKNTLCPNTSCGGVVDICPNSAYEPIYRHRDDNPLCQSEDVVISAARMLLKSFIDHQDVVFRLPCKCCDDNPFLLRLNEVIVEKVREREVEKKVSSRILACSLNSEVLIARPDVIVREQLLDGEEIIAQIELAENHREKSPHRTPQLAWFEILPNNILKEGLDWDCKKGVVVTVRNFGNLEYLTQVPPYCPACLDKYNQFRQSLYNRFASKELFNFMMERFPQLVSMTDIKFLLSAKLRNANEYLVQILEAGLPKLIATDNVSDIEILQSACDEVFFSPSQYEHWQSRGLNLSLRKRTACRKYLRREQEAEIGSVKIRSSLLNDTAINAAYIEAEEEKSLRSEHIQGLLESLVAGGSDDKMINIVVFNKLLALHAYEQALEYAGKYITPEFIEEFLEQPNSLQKSVFMNVLRYHLNKLTFDLFIHLLKTEVILVDRLDPDIALPIPAKPLSKSSNAYKLLYALNEASTNKLLSQYLK